jgi:hypothetical protein
MKTKQLATKIDSSVKEALEAVCEERGIKMNRFIEDAILDKLEEFEDVGDLKRLRQESYRPFSAVMDELKKNGKI